MVAFNVYDTRSGTNMKLSRKLLILFISYLVSSLWLSVHARVENRDYFFYRHLDYGSESLIHPVRLILNGGFGILQMDNRGNNLVDIDYRNGVGNLTWNLSHPISAIKQCGVSYFLRTQVIPISINSRDAYYWPNYTLHLIGGGMSYRMMESWFYSNNFPHPKIYALLTLTVYHFLNEVVENNEYVGYDPDPIADMYIFNPLGVLIFSSDKVARFFNQKLNMADWSYQVTFNPFDKTINNLGQNFVMKFWLNKDESLGLFYHFGTHGELGLSFKQKDRDCLSFGFGLVAKKLVNQSKRRDLRELTADLVPSAGVFYDRNNSLLLSLTYSQTQDFKFRVNLYPGLVKIGNFSPGFHLSLNQRNQLNAGITFRFLPIGLSTSF